MAEIRVERKKGMPWWMWLLGALALIAIIFVASRGCDGRDDGTADMSRDTSAASSSSDGSASGASGADTMGGDASSQPAVAGGDTAAGGAMSGGTITDIGEILSAGDRKGMIDRSVDLSSVEVRRVISDRGFTVGSAGGPELFVMLDDKLNEGSAESRVKIEAGQRLALGGILREPPSQETEAERFRGLSKQESEELHRQDVYLHTNSIQQAQ